MHSVSMSDNPSGSVVPPSMSATCTVMQQLSSALAEWSCATATGGELTTSTLATSESVLPHRSVAVSVTVWFPSPQTWTVCTHPTELPSTAVMHRDSMSPGPSGSCDPLSMSLTLTKIQQSSSASSANDCTTTTGSSSFGLKSNVMLAPSAPTLVIEKPELLPSHQSVSGSVHGPSAVEPGDENRSSLSPLLT